MNWRILGTILLCVLLPLPLLWLLGPASFPSGNRSARGQGKVMPMLTATEQNSLLTYGRACRSDDECDPRLRCFFSMVTQDSYCVDSRCLMDSQCPEGFACQTYTANNGRDLLKACSLIGDRKEGEVCAGFTRKRQYGCKEGLVCHYRCGRPCRLDAPNSCPEGFYCKDMPTGAVCQPNCEGRACPEGKQCVSVGPQVSICATIHGQDCQRTPCPGGRICTVSDDPLSSGDVWMGCSQSCGLHDEEPPCPEGSVCDVYRCRRKCLPGDASSCGPGYRCKQRTEDLWLCESALRPESAE